MASERTIVRNALLANKMRTFDGVAIPSSILTSNRMLEASIVTEFVKLYEDGQVYIEKQLNS